MTKDTHAAGSELRAEQDRFPNVYPLLHARLVHALIVGEGMSEGDALVAADDTVTFARERAADLRAKRISRPAEPLRYADGCVGEHDSDGNPICADHLRPSRPGSEAEGASS